MHNCRRGNSTWLSGSTCDLELGISDLEFGVMNHKPHILVVEDEQHLAIGIKYNLEAEGYRVTTTADGPSALAVAEDLSQPISLVILDLMLPGMSGYAVCERIRSQNRDVPILILSARTLSEDRTRGFDMGADQYMMKPFDLDELLSRVKNLLAAHKRRTAGEPARKEAPARYQIGEARIDFERFEVEKGEQTTRLTQQEVRLLQFFIENEGRVIPRGELLEEVWELPPTVNTRAPDQFMRRLRKLFEPEPAKPRYFLTVRDVGYRFVGDET